MYQIDSVPEVVNCSCKSDLETRFHTRPWSNIGVMISPRKFAQSMYMISDYDVIACS